MPHSLEVLVDDALAQHAPGRRVWVALSGGMDSSLLLDVVAPLAKARGLLLSVIHVNHGLQEAAAEFERHCRTLCASLEVPLTVVAVNVSSAGRGIEAAAREARYAAFARHLAAGDLLLLAQHADDQAETFLLAALRGSGVRGLAGMPELRESDGRIYCRPWLMLTRAELEHEADRRGIAWCEDPSNHEDRFDRNYLRLHVMPELKARWSHASEALTRSASWLQEADALLAELATMDLAAAGDDPACLPLEILRGLSESRRRLLIRHALERLQLSPPPSARLGELDRQLRHAAGDRQVRIEWPGAEARVWRGRLYLMAPLARLDPGWETNWDGRTPLTTPWGSYRVSVSAHSAENRGALFRVTLRRGGERLRVAGRGSRDVRRLLQELDCPPWQRQRVPLVWHGNDLVAVLGVSTAQGWKQRRLSCEDSERC